MVGSFDNIEVLFMLIAIYAALKGNFVISGTSMAISLLTKPYGAFIALGLIIYVYRKNNSFKDAGKYIDELGIKTLTEALSLKTKSIKALKVFTKKDREIFFDFVKILIKNGVIR